MRVTSDVAKNAGSCRPAVERAWDDLDRRIGPREIVACCAATLIAYVGLVHEVVGATLYPNGPTLFGGPLVWHGVGVAGFAAGLLLAAGTVGLVPVPVTPLATIVGLVGGGVFVADLLSNRGFHFFAFTLVVAAAVLVATQRGAPGRVRYRREAAA